MNGAERVQDSESEISCFSQTDRLQAINNTNLQIHVCHDERKFACTEALGRHEASLLNILDYCGSRQRTRNSDESLPEDWTVDDEARLSESTCPMHTKVWIKVSKSLDDPKAVSFWLAIHLIESSLTGS